MPACLDRCMTGILVPNDEYDIPAFAERAEDLGYDSVWASELWTRDAFVALTQAAQRTDEIELGTAIVNVYSRSPATLAQAAATLERAAGGRTVLGLGTSTPKTVEDLHGLEFDNPARRLHETVELTRRYLRGAGRVSYEGNLFDVADFPALGSGVEVYAAALGPATRRATGRTADGWLPHNVPFSNLGAAFETIAETAREADREPAEITTVPYVPAAVHEEPEQARDAVRGHVAYYVGNGEGYRRAVATEYEAADEVAEAWRAGDRDTARELVTDEMVADLGIAGRAGEAREQLESVAAIDAVDEVLVVVPNGVGQELKSRTVEALGPGQ
jgi:alkanesulfonate monooxygenase SsuD/methylene tetrahydromethanopterin reductase-like flavin-dependent oxidoreductase (luciferase family)